MMVGLVDAQQVRDRIIGRDPIHIGLHGDGIHFSPRQGAGQFAIHPLMRPPAPVHGDPFDVFRKRFKGS
jgi:hypothetical protein